MSGYPREVYNIREDVTRENMRQYNERLRRIYAKCEEVNPSYWQLPLRDRIKIRNEVEQNGI